MASFRGKFDQMFFFSELDGKYSLIVKREVAFNDAGSSLRTNKIGHG